jgi:hypothetical protein
MAEDSLAVVQQGSGEAAPPAEAEAAAAPPQPTREEIIAQIKKAQEEQMATADRAARLAKARRGYRVELKHDDGRPYTEVRVLGPSVEPTDEELRAMVPLPQDRWHYATDIHGVECEPRIAMNKFGLYSIGKPGRGRKKPHMFKRKMAVHNASFRIYKTLFAQAAREADAAAKKEGKEYVGIPEEQLKKIGAKSIRLGAREVYRTIKRRPQLAQQQASRKVNNGTLPGNQVQGYINQGGQYGR